MRTTALKRHNDWKKAIRKKNICEQVYGIEYYNNLHQYSKNKVHCSCPLCAAKTGDTHSNRKITGTHQRYGKKNWKIGDKRKIQVLNDKLKEYNNGYISENAGEIFISQSI